MKLDKRIIDRQYIFDCFNADKAREFIGEDCFMTNDIELFKNLDSINVYKLDKIEDGFYDEEEDEYFDFCLPVRFSQPKEKKYRPYTLMEFQEQFHIGCSITFRRKSASTSQKCLILLGYEFTEIEHETTEIIIIGRDRYDLQELFERYEYQLSYTDDFKPFGVEVEE